MAFGERTQWLIQLFAENANMLCVLIRRLVGGGALRPLVSQFVNLFQRGLLTGLIRASRASAAARNGDRIISGR